MLGGLAASCSLLHTHAWMHIAFHALPVLLRFAMGVPAWPLVPCNLIGILIRPIVCHGNEMGVLVDRVFGMTCILASFSGQCGISTMHVMLQNSLVCCNALVRCTCC